MLAAALHLRGQELSLRDIVGRLVVAKGKKKGQHPSPATVMRMLQICGNLPIASNSPLPRIDLTGAGQPHTAIAKPGWRQHHAASWTEE